MKSTVSRIELAEADFWTGERREAARRLAGTDLKTVLDARRPVRARGE
jgi:hypothetical protein